MLDKRFFALVAAGLIAATGCSSGHAGKAAAGLNAGGGASAGNGAGAGAGVVAAGHAGGGSSGTVTNSQGNAGQQAGTNSAGGTATAPNGSNPSPHPSATEVPLNASLSRTCVTDGSVLTLTLHAEPDMRVIFDARYPDDKDGQVHGGFDSRGRTTPDGTYTSTWTVAPGTPPGSADVEVAAIGYNYHTGHQRLPFTVALTCP